MSKVTSPANKGLRTREFILERAVGVASVAGLEGLSIGRLANDLELSKSGLFAHFGSKEELQLATVGAAREIFIDRVVRSAQEHELGLAQLVALCDGYLDYSAARVFPGGCFFFAATAEFGGQGGPVRDEVIKQMREWVNLLARNCDEAVSRSELAAGAEVSALTFQLNAYLTTANWLSVSLDDPQAYASARDSIGAQLIAAGADPKSLRPLNRRARRDSVGKPKRSR